MKNVQIKKIESQHFTSYIKEIDNLPYYTYSKQQEIELIKEIQSGNNITREKFIKNYLRLVINIAKNFQQPNEELMDLIEEGNYGLLVALSKFDLTKNTRFSTYATIWIRQAIILYLHNSNKILKIAPEYNNLIKKLIVMKEKLEKELGREAREDELIEALAITELKLKKINELLHFQQLNLDVLFDCSEEEESDAEERINKKIEELLLNCSFKEANLIKLYYGIEQNFNLNEISKQTNISKKEINLIINEAKNRLKQLVQDKKIKKY